MQSLLVKDHMTADAHAIADTLNVAEAVDTLLDNHLSGAPVIDNEHCLVGFLSEKDCIKHLINSSYYRDGSPSVREIMTSTVTSVTPNTSILEVAEMMLQKAQKIYPVCLDSQLVGAIQRGAVLNALRENSSPTQDHD